MEIIKPSIDIQITKGELNTIITEAMSDALASNAIKRILNPFLANSFPQFPDFTQVSIGDTDESGATTVTLKQPRKSTKTCKPSVGDIEDVAEEPVEYKETPEPEQASPEYVG